MGGGASIFGSAASYFGSREQSRSADQATAAQSAAAAESTAEQRRQFDLTRSDLQPWRDAGTNALNMLNRASTGDFSDFTASPDYNFRRTEGMRGLENSLASRGGAFSGNALRALTEFNSNLARGEYGDWWNRQAGRAGVGQTATNVGAQLGQNTANAITGINQQLGQSIGQNALYAGNARASGINGINNSFQQGSRNSQNALGYFFGGGFGG